ncbi:glycosyltransferase family 87 protein [Hoeflea sp. BAL378]|uniref:glycosyltransferase family 87 protein n=1 Tax=Hoeflea sp. BAL378 TaxID=1547437 RepID=UPI00068CD343|nr:glycosyltransferase family 87 protein [Hoeflea sp. BAL378]
MARQAKILLLLLFALSLAFGVKSYVSLWTFTHEGLSIGSLKTPYWDFLNLWFGSRLAVSGEVAVLFDPDAYREAMRAIYGATLPDHEWSYPPSMLLVGAPLSALPLPLAYVLWTFAGALALYAALTCLPIPPVPRLLLVVSPVVLQNAFFGQNGAFTAALMIAALALAPRRPLLAGVFAGILTLKPHLGILIPVAWLAAGHWRAIFSAGVVAVGLFAATGLMFGFSVWAEFRAVTTPLMVSILEAPFPQHYHTQAMTVFIAVRALGGPLALAYGAQIATALLAIAVTFRIWRPGPGRMPETDRIILTALMALIATPYGYTYDGPAIALAAVWLALSRDLALGSRLVLWIVWLFPVFIPSMMMYQIYGFFVMIPIALALMIFFLPKAGAYGSSPGHSTR